MIEDDDVISKSSQNSDNILNQIIDATIDNFSGNLHIAKPGKILVFYQEKQRADIQITIQCKLGDRVAEYPIILDCPVKITRGGGGYLNIPFKKDDPCMVFFADRDLSLWKKGQFNIPATKRKHNITDGFCIVGFASLQELVDDYDNSLMLKYQDAKVGIEENGDAMLKTQGGEVSATSDGDLTMKNDLAEVGIDKMGFLHAKNQTTSLLIILTQLINTLIGGVVVTPSETKILPNTPGAFNQATITQLQTTLTQLQLLLK
jgi:hypothetical protein